MRDQKIDVGAQVYVIYIVPGLQQVFRLCSSQEATDVNAVFENRL